MDVTEWLEWFLPCLGRAIDGAQATLARILQKSSTWARVNDNLQVSDRQKRVLNVLLDGDNAHVSTSRYAKLATCSLDTALRDIKQLVDQGILEAGPGGGRITTYGLHRGRRGEGAKPLPMRLRPLPNTSFTQLTHRPPIRFAELDRTQTRLISARSAKTSPGPNPILAFLLSAPFRRKRCTIEGVDWATYGRSIGSCFNSQAAR